MAHIIERINNHLPSELRKHTGTAKMAAGTYRILCALDQRFSRKLDQAIAACADCGMKPGKLKSDMLKEFARIRISPEEYVRFGFYKKSEKDRNTYLSDLDVVDKLKWGEGNNILPNNKYERYLLVQPYFHRDVIRVQFPFSEEDARIYQDFISDKQSFIIKPLRGTQGHGIQKINTKDAVSLEELSKIADGECMLEETIRQGEELSVFHPSSVNTVRLATGRGRDGKTGILFALLRVGKGGSLVDNVGSGGLVSLIDLENGTVCTDAYLGTERFEKHPDTGVVFSGSIIPEWQELCRIGMEIHQAHSGQRVFGFDFAWTDKGWDLVEVNPAPSFASFQALTGEGCRPLLEERQLI